MSNLMKKSSPSSKMADGPISNSIDMYSHEKPDYNIKMYGLVMTVLDRAVVF